METKSHRYYKIRNNLTGQFKISGINGKFSRKGKLWLGSLIKNHLNLFKGWVIDTDGSILSGLRKFWGNETPEDCEVIEYELVETQRMPLVDFIEKEMKNKEL